MRAFFIAAAFTLLAASARADDLSFTGYARSLDTGELLYVESHSLYRRGTDETRVVIYRCAADSAPFARKDLDYGAERTMPTFDFTDARSGYAEGLRRDANGLVVFERAGEFAHIRTRPITPRGALVVDAGFDEFVRSHWQTLEIGSALQVPFLVPSLLKSVDFRVRKVGELSIEGETASVVRLSLAGALGWFLPDIDVSYRKRDQRLMRYSGLTNIRDVHGKLLEAQIDFPGTQREQTTVSRADLLALPLTSRCR